MAIGMEISSKGYCVVRRVQQAGWVDTLLKSWEDFHLQEQSIFWGDLTKGFLYTAARAGFLGMAEQSSL